MAATSSYRRPVSRSRSRGRYGAPSSAYRRRPSRSRSRSRGHSRSRSPSRSRYHDRYERRGGDRHHDRYNDRYGGRDAGRSYYGRDNARFDSAPQRRTREVYRGTEEERGKSTTLYIGNLPFGYSDRDVAAMMERFGRVRKITVPIDHVRRHNRGFSFVEFEERRDAEDALAKYQGYTIEGRVLRIDWDVGSDRKPSSGPSGSVADSYGGMSTTGSNNGNVRTEVPMHDDASDY